MQYLLFHFVNCKSFFIGNLPSYSFCSSSKLGVLQLKGLSLVLALLGFWAVSVVFEALVCRYCYGIVF